MILKYYRYLGEFRFLFHDFRNFTFVRILGFTIALLDEPAGRFQVALGFFEFIVSELASTA